MAQGWFEFRIANCELRIKSEILNPKSEIQNLAYSQACARENLDRFQGVVVMTWTTPSGLNSKMAHTFSVAARRRLHPSSGAKQNLTD